VYCHNPDTWTGRAGRRMIAADVLAQAGRSRPFIGAAGGGLTVSGGEPLPQPAFTPRKDSASRPPKPKVTPERRSFQPHHRTPVVSGVHGRGNVLNRFITLPQPWNLIPRERRDYAAFAGIARREGPGSAARSEVSAKPSPP
jgi:hypothetical protein